jgi:RHH-type rel operon transcriptional repressor/antitoxin RelB
LSQVIRLTVFIPDELHRRAKAEAALQGTSLSAVVRHALEEFLEDAEDVAIAEETMARMKRGEERTISREELWAELDALPD